MSLCVSLSPLFPQGAPEWKDKNFNFKEYKVRRCWLRGKRGTRHFALWKRGVADMTKKKVTCIKKTCTDHARLYLTTQASSFIPFDLSLSVFLARQKEYFTIILHEIWWRATQPGRQGGGSITLLGLATDAKVAQFSAPSCVSADDLPLPAPGLLSLPSRCRSSSLG